MRRLPGSRKAVLMEEAWQALAKKGMSEYVLYLVKTFRKFNGELITVSQEIEDMISNPIVKMAIINNSDTRILLDQQKFRNRFEPIQELLGMTDDEVALALSVNRSNEPGRSYKEVFISMQNAPAKVYRTEVSRQEYYCYTTREDEKVRVQAYAEKYGGIAEGIDALIIDQQNK
jgi:type IV secretory pathway VirB4 component